MAALEEHPAEDLGALQAGGGHQSDTQDCCVICLDSQDAEPLRCCSALICNDCSQRWERIQQSLRKNRSCPVSKCPLDQDGLPTDEKQLPQPAPAVCRESLISRIRFLIYKVKHCRQCPGCNITIVKDGGCHHITCSECNTRFCWKCGFRLTNGTCMLCTGVFKDVGREIKPDPQTCYPKSLTISPSAEGEIKALLFVVGVQGALCCILGVSRALMITLEVLDMGAYVAIVLLLGSSTKMIVKGMKVLLLEESTSKGLMDADKIRVAAGNRLLYSLGCLLFTTTASFVPRLFLRNIIIPIPFGRTWQDVNCLVVSAILNVLLLHLTLTSWTKVEEERVQISSLANIHHQVKIGNAVAGPHSLPPLPASEERKCKDDFQRRKWLRLAPWTAVSLIQVGAFLLFVGA